MSTDRLPKILLHYKPRGYHSVGRPIARWLEEEEEYLTDLK
jgi:hypothetical protein